MAQIQDATGDPIIADVKLLNTILSALNSEVLLDIVGQACAAIQVEAIGTMTLSFEATVDGTDFFPVFGVVPGTGASATSTTTNGIWIFEVGAFTKFRVRVSAYTVGTVSVSAKASQGTTVVQLAAGSLALPAAVDQGSPAVVADAWPIKITDGVDVAAVSGLGALLVDATFAGDVTVVGKAADGAAVAGFPVRIGGKDGGGLTQDIITDATGVLAVQDNGGSITVDAAALPLPTGASTSALQLPDGHNVTVDNAGGGAAVNIQDGGNSITIDGTITATPSGTQDVNLIQVAGTAVTVGSGVLGAGTQRVVLATDQPVVPVSDNGGSLTVDAATLPLPTGAATSALQLPDGHNVTVDNAAGAAAVNVQDGGNSLTIDAASLPLPTGAATSALQTQPGVDIGDVTINNAAGASAVNIQDGGNSITVDGTVAVSGAVDTELPAAVALADATANPTVPAVGAFGMVWNGATWDRQMGDPNGTEVQGAVAHDAAVAGRPVLIAARANANEPTAVADADATHLWADLFGRLVVLPGHPSPEPPVSLNATASGDTTVIAAPGAGSLHILKASVHNRAGTTRVVALRDGTAGTIRWRAELGVNGGGSLIDFGARGWKLTATTLLAVNLDAAGDVDVNITEFYIAL